MLASAAGAGRSSRSSDGCDSGRLIPDTELAPDPQSSISEARDSLFGRPMKGYRFSEPRGNLYTHDIAEQPSSFGNNETSIEGEAQFVALEREVEIALFSPFSWESDKIAPGIFAEAVGPITEEGGIYLCRIRGFPTEVRVHALS